MLKIIAGVTAAVFFSAVACLLVIHSQGPSTAQLDGDLAAVQASISDTQSDEARFANGLILTEIQLRLEILENTRAMLEQKRTSFLRGIDLVFSESGTKLTGDDAAEKRYDAQIAQVDADAKAAETEAVGYTGGLIQAMILVRAETNKTTVATLEQQKVLARYGILLPPLSSSGGLPTTQRPAATMPLGPKAEDKDALQ